MEENVTGPIDPQNPGNRAKAYRFRAKIKKGEALTPEQVAWLADYDHAQQTASFGASASERLIHVEERSAAVGTGSAAEVAAAAALAREEGRRIDYLAKTGIDALVQACNLYRNMTEALLERTLAMEEVHIGMLGTVREQYLARTQAEVEAMQAEEGNEVNQLIQVLMARLAGGGGAPPTLPPGHRKPRRVNRRK